MARTTARRRLAARNARLMAANGMRPAPHDPGPVTRGVVGGDGRLERDSSSVERKQVPEEVGCTLTRLDWKQNRRTTETSHSNSGSKLGFAEISDGTIRDHKRRR